VTTGYVEPPRPGADPATAVSVSEVTRLARDVLEGYFQPLWIRGEVSGFKSYSSGHWYFSLRDRQGQLRCVVWSGDQRRIPAPPDEGMQVTAWGQLTVYPTRGEMQFVIRALQAEGDGLRQKAFDLTRRKLEADGLLSPARKRAIPRYPRRIVVVTSPDGAALRDIIAVVKRRAPAVEIVVVAATVQGDGAPEELCLALDRVARWRDADTMIIGRGGGSREDLWTFNNERVARALADSPIPTISAVGHEVDFTICDLVADLRAPTPSAAAEAAVPDMADLRTRLETLRRVVAARAERRVNSARARLDRTRRALAVAGARVTERRAARVTTAAGRLHALSPLNTLARGYAVARAEGGGALPSAALFAPGTPFDLLLRDGIVRAITESATLVDGGPEGVLGRRGSPT
jgi:exodeoxyribonuclease VII large subunit